MKILIIRRDHILNWEINLVFLEDLTILGSR